MSNPLIEQNPLHIPEIRSRISRFVAVKDAISCVCVSKKWSKDFAFSIWYSVDFKIHLKFEQLDAKIIDKHGHHVRIVENLRTQAQLDALLRPNITNVQILNVTCTNSVRFCTLCLDLISNNNRNLQRLTLEMDGNVKTRDFSARTISVHALVPHASFSQLSKIRLLGVCFSRNSFVSVLKGCPLLTSVDLQNDVTLLSGPPIDAFQHAGVVLLLAPISQVFMPDTGPEPSPLGSSLLAHFPNLIEWHCYNLQSTTIVPMERIKAEVRTYCPRVSKIDTWKTPGPIIYGLVANVFCNLKSVTFDYGHLSADIIAAMLIHKATLLDIFSPRNGNNSYTERDEVLSEDDHFQHSGRTLQLLPRSCPNLLLLTLEHHEMDMDIVEEEEWACKGLQELRVRFRCLDTKEKIDKALQLWLDTTKNDKNRAADESKETGHERATEKENDEGSQLTNLNQTEPEDTSTETRVAEHLLKFKKLKSVWLGTRTCYATGH